MITLASHWSTCKWNNMQGLCALPAYMSRLIIHCMGGFLLEGPVDQQWRKVAVRFYSWWCIMRLGADVLASKIRLAMAVVVEP